MTIKYILKNIMGYFGLAFLFVFLIFFMDQAVLIVKEITEYEPSVSNIFLLIACTIPSSISIGIPFAVCIGFIYGFVKIDIISIIGKKLIYVVLIIGILLSIISYMNMKFVVPVATEYFSNLYEKIQIVNENDCIAKVNMDVYRNSYIYKLEQHKIYVISLGTLFFSFFAVYISIILSYCKLKHNKIFVLSVGILSCIIYWILLWAGQKISVNYKNLLFIWIPNFFILCVSVSLWSIYKKMTANAHKNEADIKRLGGT